MDLNNLKYIHFTGIKGVGLTALALCAQDLKIKISGSDTAEKFVTDAILKTRGIAYQIGFSPSHIAANCYAQPANSLLVYTAAHQGAHNPEVIAAQKAKIPILNHGAALGLFMQDKAGISVCGVGGKTTTSAMIATILDLANLKPSYAIGVGNIPGLGAPGRYQTGSKYFVTEADEYFAAPPVDNTPKFLYQHPEVIVATNISYDHPDVYDSFVATQQAFLKFFAHLPADGVLVACADNPDTLAIAKLSGKNLVTYGSHPQSDFRLKNYHFTDSKTLFRLSYQGIDQDYVLNVPGRFNVLNAIAAIAVATHLGIDQPTCVRALKEFTGTMRRFEILGKVNNITVVDDYAHHPSEIAATLKAAKDWFPTSRIIAVFQPHTFSRTKALFNEFTRSFASSDEVIFLPIYASARETADPEVSSQKLCQETSKFHPRVSYQESPDTLIKYLKQTVSPSDVILTLGAGDIFLLGPKLLAEL